MSDWIVAVPAYGRDYKTAQQVKDHWKAGKDFQCQPSGQYINKQDADKYNVTVELRFDKRQKLVVIEPEIKAKTV